MAEVAGPGALAQRTDLGVTGGTTNMEYGDRQTLENFQKAAPIAGTRAGDANQASAAPDVMTMLQGLTPLDAPTMNPDQPVTAGTVPTGPAQPSAAADAQALGTGQVLALLRAASDRDAPPSFQRAVRQIFSNL